MYCKTILKGLSLFFLVCGLTATAEGRAVSCLMRGTADNLLHESKESQESLMSRESAAAWTVSTESAVVPAWPGVPEMLHPQDSITVHYPSGYRHVVPSYNGNAAALDSVIAKVRSYMESDRDFEVIIRSYSSPDGELRLNNRLTRLRGDSLSSYIIRYTGIDPEKVKCEPKGIGYDILHTLVESDPQVPDREQVLHALETVPETVEHASGAVTEQLKLRLLTIGNGRPYAYMKQNMFPRLRNSMSVLFIVRRPDAGEPLRQSVPQSVREQEVYALEEYDPILTAVRPSAGTQVSGMVAEGAGGTDAVPAAPVDSAAGIRPAADTAAAGKTVSDGRPSAAGRTVPGGKTPFSWESSRWWLKTNLPFYALVVPNLAVEVRLADHWSLDIPAYYSPYTVARTYRYRVFAVQPSVRYWLKPGMKGHFFGLHLTGGMFNISVDEQNRYQDTDGMWGAGLDYGYALKFSKHWGMEFNIGVGYIWTRYDTFYNIENGVSWDTSTANYLGITRLGISLIYKL